MARILQLMAFALVPVLVVKIYDVLYMTDYLKKNHAYFHEPGPCQLVKGVEEGSEDLQVTSGGIALITSGLKFAGDFPKTRNRKGKILMFDLNKRTTGATEVKVEGDMDMKTFHPHGLSLWEDEKTGEVTVFVVNHATGQGDSVEKFIFDQKSKVLKHVVSYTSEEFRVMNDLVATSDSTFYATNYFFSMATGFFERYLRLPWGSVVFFDGGNGHLMISGLLGPNGINTSPDGRTLYVSSFWNEQILIYTRLEDNTLSLRDVMDVYTRPDNINIDKNNGDLWVAAHPLYHRLNKHDADPMNIPSPSQVIRIRQNSKIIEEIYSEDGVQLYGSTVAERYKNSMLIGTVSHKMLYCELKHIKD